MPHMAIWAAATIEALWGEAIIIDENFQSLDWIDTEIVWISLIWTPYIPESLRIIEEISSLKNNIYYVLWWPSFETKWKRIKWTDWKKYFVHPWINEKDFSSLYWSVWNVINGMNESGLLSMLDLKWKLPDSLDVSFQDIYKKIPDNIMKFYLWKEFSFHVADGCSQMCDFYAATSWIPEKYRAVNVVYGDMTYLVKKAQSFGYSELNLYCDNLDIFQNPKKLQWFMEVVLIIKKENPWFQIHLRWLAWIPFGEKILTKYADIIWLAKEAWFHTVWYWVDGMAPEIWKWTNKLQNKDAEQCLRVIELTHEAWITSELLMVIGHEWLDTPASLKDSYDFVVDMIDKYGAVPRPHIARKFSPNNAWWIDPNYRPMINRMIEDPDLFQAVDYTSLANKLTHPYSSQEFRDTVNNYYTLMTELPHSTVLIESYDYDDSPKLRQEKKDQNKWKYDR